VWNILVNYVEKGLLKINLLVTTLTQDPLLLAWLAENAFAMQRA
jgi:hypothetical protein